MGVHFLYPRSHLLTPLAINFAGAGDQTVIAAIASQRIAVHRIWLVVAGATNLTFKDGAGTNLSGAVAMAANGGLTFDTTGEPWFVTSLGNAFIINSSAGVQVSGIVYSMASA